MSIRNELYKAVSRNQRVTVRMFSGDKITGVAEVSTDDERVKIRTSEGPTWVPYGDIEHVSRVIIMFEKIKDHKG